MLSQRQVMVSLALVLCTLPASAGTLVYVVNNSQQFGTLDLATGAYQQIGPNTPEGETGLVPGPNGSLLTLTFSGNLDSINPATGVTSFVGATGLADCTTPVSPCGPTSANTLGELGGTIYATDFQNSLYTVDPLTGAATLIGPTGIPAVPFIPGTTNPDGSFDLFDEGLFGAGGELFATFDAFTLNPMFGTITPVIAPDLYQIDPSTGLATLVGPTGLNLGAGAVEVNGAFYDFDDFQSQVLTLDLANGNTSFVGSFDPAAGVITGASPTPEPASIALVCIGMAVIVIRSRRRRSS